MSVRNEADLPRRVLVAALISSRYPSNERPLSWDDRAPGVDTIKTTEGEQIKLFSDGGQSPPRPGWVLLLTGGNRDDGYTWTLYGIPRGAETSEISSH